MVHFEKTRNFFAYIKNHSFFRGENICASENGKFLTSTLTPETFEKFSKKK